MPDGRSLLYSVITGPRESHDLWKLTLDTGAVTRLTKLRGRRGNLSENFTTDGRYLSITPGKKMMVTSGSWIRRHPHGTEQG